jgi:hypothetical protein
MCSFGLGVAWKADFLFSKEEAAAQTDYIYFWSFLNQFLYDFLSIFIGLSSSVILVAEPNKYVSHFRKSFA